MKLSDYIVTFLQKKGIRHFFGYQGTMIAHLVDSIERNPETENHSGYNEQGAAFAACGYAQAKEECACAYATSGPDHLCLYKRLQYQKGMQASQHEQPLQWHMQHHPH